MTIGIDRKSDARDMSGMLVVAWSVRAFISRTEICCLFSARAGKCGSRVA